jgi:hypothetical protein
MTQTALARLVERHVPSVVYVPNQMRSSVDTPQRGVDRYVGYRALWMKVIIRAAFDWVSYRDSQKLEQRKVAEFAFVWLFKPSQLFNSFENICHLVDLPPEKIRRWAKKLTKDHVAKIEHLERDPAGPNQVEISEAQRNLIEAQPEECEN